MDMTPQQVDELLDRIRAERGEAIDPARIADLLDAEALEATAFEVLELAEAELTAAEQKHRDAAHDADLALHEYSTARYQTKRLLHELALVRTASGYKTARQAADDATAARAAEPHPLHGCTVCGRAGHADSFHADPVTGLIGGISR